MTRPLVPYTLLDAAIAGWRVVATVGSSRKVEAGRVLESMAPYGHLGKTAMEMSS